jgi:Spy/CpxP family protein refolding chaperone
MRFLLALFAALLLLYTPVNAGAAQADDKDLPHWTAIGVPIFLLVANAAVQDELRLSAKQRTEVADLVNASKEIYRGWSKLDWKARDQKTITEQMMTSNRLGKILRPEQLKRLEQIDHQRRGPVIILDDGVAAPLKLKREQRQKLEILAERTEMARNHLSLQLAGADPKDSLRGRKIADELVKLLADGCVKVEAELSDEQKKEWRSIRGKPFDLGSLFQSRPVFLD